MSESLARDLLTKARSTLRVFSVGITPCPRPQCRAVGPSVPPYPWPDARHWLTDLDSSLVLPTNSPLVPHPVSTYTMEVKAIVRDKVAISQSGRERGFHALGGYPLYDKASIVISPASDSNSGSL